MDGPAAVAFAKTIAVSGSVNVSGLRLASHVLNTAELLETILVHVPVDDLLRLEATCKGFKLAIAVSITTRRLMHRAPDDSVFPRRPLESGLSRGLVITEDRCSRKMRGLGEDAEDRSYGLGIRPSSMRASL